MAAYYYPWFAPNHAKWDAGFVRSQLDPPQEPLLGQYTSRDPAVIDQHFAWAHTYGVGAFLCSWSGPGSYSDGTIRDWLLPSPARGPTQIGLVYESLTRFRLGPDERIHLDTAGVQRLVDDFDAIARSYFGVPGYYEIDGRPVVVIYASRVFVGPFAQAIHEIRQHLESVYGVDPYLVGDEVDWNQRPSPARIKLFDAITGYTLYSRTQPASWSTAEFLRRTARRLSLYRRVAEREGVAFIPGAMPGYDDRGERLAENHHVLPRSLGPAPGEPTLLDETLGLAGALVDPRLDLVTVTSWNEWGEDTQIEPTAPAPAADGPAALTQGYPFTAYGMAPLEQIAAFERRWDDGPRAPVRGALPSR